MKKQPCIVLTGPTAVGKSALAVRLAKAVGGEIVSADSMQVYRGLDIGSAKITNEEMEGIPHHLIDVLDPKDSFNVYRFCQMAEDAMRGIYERGRIPIITGGTGFYIQALLKGVDFSESSADEEIRARLVAFAKEAGSDALYERLKAVDPTAAEEIHQHNQKRVIRALQFYEETGHPISEHNRRQREREVAYRLAYFVLTDDRAQLYQRINARVDKMVADGLFDEVASLLSQGLSEEHTSMKGLGYRELIPYFAGEITKEEAITQIKTDSRHYAKRQLTWFRREENVIWVDKAAFAYDEDAILAFMLDRWQKEERVEHG